MSDPLYRILYVDDDQGLLDIGKIFLEDAGQFSVDIITSAPAALTQMNSKNYDAIISDYQMPKMDGIEFLKRVRASGNTTPFILFTGRGREEVVIQALNEGADFYLQKGGEPVAQFAELAHKIRQAVQQRRAEASIRDHERREADIINFLPDATFAIDMNGVVIAWNRAMEEMTGVRAAEMLGKGNYEYSIAVYRERRPILIDLVLHDDPAIAAKYPSLKKDGHTLIAEAVSPNLYNGKGAAIWFTAAPLYDTKGEMVGAIESIRDITERKQAEEVLAKSRHQLAEAMDLAHLVNWEFDVGTGIFTFDDRFYALFGTTAVREGGYQMKAETYAREFLHPDDQHLVAEEVKKDLETTDPHYQSTIEHRIIRRDGEVRYVLVRIGITKDAQGRTIKTHGANQDITDLKRAEVALRESHNRFVATIASLDDAVFLVDPATRLIIECNDATTRIFGYSREELVGRETDFLHVDQAHREQFGREAYATYEDPGYYTREFEMRRKDGCVFPTEHFVRPIHDPDGRILYVVSVVRDITERKRVEGALRESENRFRTLAEAALDGIMINDRGVITDCNSQFAKMFGYKPEEIIGRNGFEFMLTAESRDEIFRWVQNGAKGTIDITGIKKDGSMFSGETTATTVLWQGKQHSIVQMRDITERKRAEEALRESEEKYRGILENIQDVYYRSDTPGNFLMVSPSITPMLGYDMVSELLGKNIAQTIYYNPEERSKFLDELNTRGSVTDYEVTLKKRDGTPVYVSTSSHKYYDHNGNYIGVEGVFRDITERKRAEDLIVQQSRNLSIINEIIITANRAEDLRELLEVCLDNTLQLLDYDGGGIYLVDAENKTASLVHTKDLPDKFFDRVRTVATGKRPYDTLFLQGEPIITDNSAGVSPALVASGFRSLASIPLVARGKVIGALNVASRKRDTVTDQERAILLSIGQELGTTINRMAAEGELVKKNDELSAANEQITATEEELRANLDELTRQERELQESKKELADIIEFLPDATFAINKTGEVIAWNHAMEVMTGLDKADMIGKGNYEYSLPFYQERRPILIDLVFGYDEIVAEKYQGVRKDGDRLIAEIYIPHLHNVRGAYLWFTSSPLYDSQGKITGAIESIREITEHKEREATLNRKNEELSAAYEEITSTEEELRQQVEEIVAARQDLRKSEERYRNIIEDQTEFICRFLPEGTHIFVNDAYCRYFGVAREDIVGHRFRPVIHADDRAAFTAFFASLTPENPVGEIDHRIIMPDGTIRWQRWSDRAIFDDKGIILEYQSVGRDITDYKQVEEQLQQTVNEFESLLENMSDVYYRSDGKGNLILASRSWATLLGYSDLSECIGKNIASDFYADPTERSRFLELVYRNGSVTDYEVVLKGKDGSHIPVATSSYLYFDESGQILGVEGTFRDITERKRVMESLKEAERRLTDIINFLPDATLAIDRNGRVIAWNRAIEEMTGVSAADMIGKGNYEYAVPFYGERRPILIDLIFEDDAVLKNYSSVRREGNVLTAETGLAHLGGKNLILWGKASPLYNARGEMIGAIESIRDFTERRMLEDSLKHLNKKLNLLSSVTRHDIKNNLTVCRGYLAILKRNSPPAETLKLIANLEKSIGAIQSQLDFTRVYQDLGAAAPVWQDIGGMLQKCPAAQNIAVISELPRLEVFADPLVGKVFYNLHDNSVRHGEHATEVHIRAENRGNEMVIVWEDNGVGVPPQEKELIFERGFGKNTGLGLFLVREILSITHMTIRETGEAGKGVRFEITVPNGAYRFQEMR